MYPYSYVFWKGGVPVSAKKLAADSMMAALCAVLGYTALDLGTLKITFESLPVIFAALMFGPSDGILVGITGTFIYQVLRYGLSPTTPLWILPYAAAGLIAGAYAKKHDFSNSGREIRIIIFTAELTIFIFNTLAIYVDSKVFGYYSVPYVWGKIGIRFLICLVKSAVFGAFTPKLLIRLSGFTGNGRKNGKI